MVTLLRNGKRRHLQRGRQDVWRSFVAESSASPFANGFGFLTAFDEMRLPPGDSTEPHSENEAEIVTYVYKGALSQEDSTGSSGVIHAGEYQRMSTGRRIVHKETSVSRSDWVHLFRMSLRPSQLGLGRAHEQKRFTAAQRRNLLCVVASPDGRCGSLRIHQEALVYSAIFEPGHHIVHELELGRTAWLHIVSGEATLDDVVLTEGDGVGITHEPAFSLTIQAHTEMLLLDLGPDGLSRAERASSRGRPAGEKKQGRRAHGLPRG